MNNKSISFNEFDKLTEEWMAIGRAEERKHLIGMVERMFVDVSEHDVLNLARSNIIGYNQALKDILKAISDPSEGVTEIGLGGAVAEGTVPMVDMESGIQEETECCEEKVEQMVARFLSWKLPADFHPDAGISFQPYFNVEYMAKQGKPPMRSEPVGTNLFDAIQAKTMVRYMLDCHKPRTEVSERRCACVEDHPRAPRITE